MLVLPMRRMGTALVRWNDCACHVACLDRRYEMAALDRARERLERELDEEVEAHFALEIQQRLEAGATREEAESGARRDFWNVSRIKEVTRNMWGWA